MSMDKVRIGIVGGSFGTTFQFHEDPGCTVEAVCELDPERLRLLQETYNCGKKYRTFDEMLKDPNINAVGIFTDAPQHVSHATAAMKAGKHVLSAVPAGISIAECEELLEVVKSTGMTYMMAETSWYHQTIISARKWLAEGRFGDIYYTEAEYHHAGLEVLFENEDGSKTWRHGFPPMHYPTHCTALLTGLTGETLTEVSCIGWGNDDPRWTGNAWNNPFWNETALFTTSGGNAFRAAIFWYGAHRGTERAQWYGEKMSFFAPHPNGLGPVIVRTSDQTEKDLGGFERQLPAFEHYEQELWWGTDMLPEPMRHESYHDGSHTFLTHEFVDALLNGRRPAIDVVTALNLTVPGIVAHQSALKGGERLSIPQYRWDW